MIPGSLRIKLDKKMSKDRSKKLRSMIKGLDGVKDVWYVDQEFADGVSWNMFVELEVADRTHAEQINNYVQEQSDVAATKLRVSIL